VAVTAGASTAAAPIVRLLDGETLVALAEPRGEGRLLKPVVGLAS
jgi:hypothetical protein